MVVKTKGGYQVRSKKTGKLYPKKYKSKKEAEKQVARHQMFKAMDKE